MIAGARCRHIKQVSFRIHDLVEPGLIVRGQKTRLERDDILIKRQDSDSAVFSDLGLVHRHNPDRQQRLYLGDEACGSDKAHDIVTRDAGLPEAFEPRVDRRQLIRA